MKTTTALLALAALAPLATAQLNPVVTLTADDADGNVNIGDVVTWTVAISWTSNGTVGGGDDYLFGANLRFIGIGGILFDLSTATAGTSIGPGTVFNGGGVAGNILDNITFADASKSQFGGSSDNPFIFASFTTTITGGNVNDTLSFDVDKRSLGTTAALTIASGGAFAPPFVTNNFQDADDFTVVSDTITLIPTPGALALLGLSGLGAARRRR